MVANKWLNVNRGFWKNNMSVTGDILSQLGSGNHKALGMLNYSGRLSVITLQKSALFITQLGLNPASPILSYCSLKHLPSPALFLFLHASVSSLISNSIKDSWPWS